MYKKKSYLPCGCLVFFQLLCICVMKSNARIELQILLQRSSSHLSHSTCVIRVWVSFLITDFRKKPSPNVFTFGNDLCALFFKGTWTERLLNSTKAHGILLWNTEECVRNIAISKCLKKLESFQYFCFSQIVYHIINYSIPL